MLVTVVAPGVYNEFGQLVTVGSTVDVSFDFGVSLVQSQKARDTSGVLSGPSKRPFDTVPVVETTVPQQVYPALVWGDEFQPAKTIMRKYNLLTLGCKLDGFVFYGGHASTGSAVVIVDDALFEAGRDEGKYLRMIANTQSAAPSGALRGRIVSVNSPTQVTLDAASTATFDGSGIYGTDDTEPFLAALAEATLTGGEVLVPAGNPTGKMTGHCILRPSSKIIWPGGVTLLGEGADYGRVQDPPNQGSGVYLLNYLGGVPFIQLGPDGSGGSITSGVAAPKIKGIAIDAMRLATQAVFGVARRADVRECTIWRGTGGALSCGPDGWYVNNKCAQQNEGSYVIKVVGDSHVIGNVARQAGLNGSQILVAAMDAVISHNHMFSGGGGDVAGAALASTNMTITNPSSSTDGGLLEISDNIFDSTYGAHIKFVISGSRTIQGVGINDNYFFSGNNVPAATFPVLDFAHGAGTTVRGVTFAGSVGNGGINNDTTYSAIVAKSGAGSVVQFDTDSNHIANCQKIFDGIRPDAGVGQNSIMRGTGLGGATFYSRKGGTATLDGTGSQTVFVIAHGLDATPVEVTVTAGSAAARGDFYATADNTNITVTYTAAPASGTGNVVLYWAASL